MLRQRPLFSIYSTREISPPPFFAVQHTRPARNIMTVNESQPLIDQLHREKVLRANSLTSDWAADPSCG